MFHPCTTRLPPPATGTPRHHHGHTPPQPAHPSQAHRSHAHCRQRPRPGRRSHAPAALRPAQAHPKKWGEHREDACV